MLVKNDPASRLAETPAREDAVPPARTARPTFLKRFGRPAAQILLPLVLLAGAYAGYQAIVGAKPPVPSRPAQERVFAITTVAAEIGTHQPRIRLYGQTVPARRVDLRALVAGQVSAVGEGLREGGIVSAGDMLVEIDDFAYRGAVREAGANLAEGRARLAEMEARVAAERAAALRAQEQVALAERDLERALELSQAGSLADRTVDDRRLIVLQRQETFGQRQSNLQIEEARAVQQRAAIERLEWQVAQAERRLAETVLRAPFDAYVRGAEAEVGRMLSANDLVATLIDRKAIDVRATLSDQQYGRLAREAGDLIGRDIDVRWHIGGEPVAYRARIERTAAEIDMQSGGVDVYARVELDEAGALLRPGAFVEIELADRAYADVLRLPESALYDGNLVYVVEDRRLRQRRVELVGFDGDHVLVRGDFANGERINTTRMAEIGEGVLVEERPS